MNTYKLISTAQCLQNVQVCKYQQMNPGLINVNCPFHFYVKGKLGLTKRLCTKRVMQTQLNSEQRSCIVTEYIVFITCH